MASGNTVELTLPKRRRRFPHVLGRLRRQLRRHRRKAIWAGVGVGLAVTAVLILTFVSVPYYALYPGDVYSATGAVSSPSEPTYEPMSLIGFVTVSSNRTDSLWEWARAHFDSSASLQHEDVFNRGMRPAERRRHDTRLMTRSQEVSVFVALRELGYEVPDTEALVSGLVPCMPAEDHLAVEDVILEVDGARVSTAKEVSSAVRSRAVGEVVRFVVRRAGDTETTWIDVPLGSSADPCLTEDTRTSAADERPLLGVLLADEMGDFGVDISFATGGIAGPSAGLAFTLSILDLLTPGELTEGRPLAVTGTMSLDGSVGAVGGVRQKVKAVERRNFRRMLVPEGQYEEARSAASESLEIIEVATLAEALQAAAPNWSPPEA